MCACMSAQVAMTSANVPHYLIRFIGLERDIAQLDELLTDPRLAPLTMPTGVGSCGKAGLASKAARALANHGSGKNRRESSATKG